MDFSLSLLSGLRECSEARDLKLNGRNDRVSRAAKEVWLSLKSCNYEFLFEAIY